jgi:GABA(A) receptor-associated protein
MYNPFREKPPSSLEAQRLLSKYSDRVPVIVSKNPRSANTPEIDKNKFLVPIDLTVGQFMYVIRKRLQLSPEKALFLFIDGEVACNAELVSTVYYKMRSPDGFLYAVYSCENVFGYMSSSNNRH